MLYRYLLLLFYASVHCALIPPLAQPTPSTTNTLSASKPTPFLHKRDDVAENLELYQQWANICRGNTKNNQVALAGDVNNLWHTVTTTVNCGNGHAVTVTTTVSKTTIPTATATASASCEGDCWSDYLWRFFFFFFYKNHVFNIYFFYRYLW
jgi:hypothetical protein